jgi:hypothetical protein
LKGFDPVDEQVSRPPAIGGRPLGDADSPDYRVGPCPDPNGRLTKHDGSVVKGTNMNRLTWDDVPAILLTIVSAVTVTAGARLLRGQNQFLMLGLGVGVAGATFVLDRLLVERLNALRPRQSLLALLVCWLPLFLFATALATIATFSWIAPEMARRDLEQSRRAHWTHEAAKVSTYLVLVKTALRRQVDKSQVEIETERQRAAVARREGSAYSTEPIRLMQRRLGSIREMERRLPALRPLPLDLPADQVLARDEIDRTSRELADLHASAMLALGDAPPLPAYEPFTPPSGDIQSVLAEETQKRSWTAITAWGAAAWVELLPLVALWRGGRRIPLATRISQWRSRVGDTIDAVRGRRASSPLPIVIEPLKVRGVVRVVRSAEYTLTECAPLLEEAVNALTGVPGSYELSHVSNARGERLDDSLPLLPQLKGEPLVLSVVEGHL